MLQYTDDYLTINGVKIHYYRTGGKKPPFILLHGATDNGLCWTPVAELLSKNYDVIMPDAQGHGLSDRLTRGLTYENHLHQVAGLVRQLGLKKPIIMGHSMGAGTAVNVAVAYPSLPRAIILEDPPWTDPPAAELAEGQKKAQKAFHEFLTGLANLSLEKILEESRKRDPSWAEEDRLAWARAKLQFDPSLFSTMVLNPLPYNELVSRINSPTLLTIAENGIVSKKIAENATKLWKSRQPFKWVQIKGATHNIRRDNFPAFRDAVFAFLESLPA